MSSVGGVGGASGATGGGGAPAAAGPSAIGGTTPAGGAQPVSTTSDTSEAEKVGSPTFMNNISTTNVNIQMNQNDFQGIKAMGESSSCSHMDTKKMLELLLMVMMMKMMQDLMGEMSGGGNSMGFSATA